MSTHNRRIVGIVAVALAFCAPSTPARSQDTAPSGGELIEVNDVPTMEKVLAEPGVVVVDCFADW